MTRRFLLLVPLIAGPAAAGPLDEMPLDRWAKLREAERYQMQAAERYYKQQNWKAALSEYEKFLTLYEKSEGAPFAQLKWSLCQVHLRKANTAIKDGFQSVIDYWPDSPDAALARYHIGRTYKDMGQLDKAKKALAEVLKGHKQDPVAAYTLADLADIAEIEQDFKARAECWKKITFEIKREAGMDQLCREVAKKYAGWCFSEGVFDDGAKTLSTFYPPAEVPDRLVKYGAPPVTLMAAEAQTRPKAERMAAQAIAFLRGLAPGEATTPEQKQSLRKVLAAVLEFHAAAGQEPKVLEVHQEIIRRCGMADESLGQLGAWHETKERFDEAFKIYRRFEKKPDGLARIAASMIRRKQFEAAANVYREASLVDTANTAKWLGEAGGAYRQGHKFAEALNVFRDLLKSDATNTQQWLWNIGLTQSEAGQWKEAIGTLRQCTNFPENYKLMAACHRRLTQYREALMLYNQIMGGDEGQAPWAAAEIAATWEEAGKKEEAIKALQAVCKRFPKSAQASAAHARLQDVYKISITLGGAKDE
jgi:tetratricopeptide (TPR) repeat protein